MEVVVKKRVNTIYESYLRVFFKNTSVSSPSYL